jgi:hypothetical protein
VRNITISVLVFFVSLASLYSGPTPRSSTSYEVSPSADDVLWLQNCFQNRGTAGWKNSDPVFNSCRAECRQKASELLTLAANQCLSVNKKRAQICKSSGGAIEASSARCEGHHLLLNRCGKNDGSAIDMAFCKGPLKSFQSSVLAQGYNAKRQRDQFNSDVREPHDWYWRCDYVEPIDTFSFTGQYEFAPGETLAPYCEKLIN